MQIEKKSGTHEYAVILVGGGLANCLIALRLVLKDPDLRIIIIESADQICGNKTWSFHATDVDAGDYSFLQPVICNEWAGQQVLFPNYERRLSTPYATITSDAMRSAVLANDAIEAWTNTRVEELGGTQIRLSDNRLLNARCVIDGRGYLPNRGLRVGFQKFVGMELETRNPHGETIPTIMDARIDQIDGYRFFYVLPLSPTRLLVEDTRYSDSTDLNTSEIRLEIVRYARERSWLIDEEIRQETGVLPISLAHDFDTYWQSEPGGPARVGMRAALFQPTTGYSLPEAVRVANIVATQCTPLDTATVDAKVRAYARNRHRSQSLMRFLNRMLFLGADPAQRYRILQRFYTLPQDLIERFYAGNLVTMDKVRILTGRPPIPIRTALGCVSEAKVLSLTD